MNKIIGFIGFGNMAGAMAKGIIGSGKVNKENVMASGKDTEKLRIKTADMGILGSTNEEIAKRADIVFLTVKPYMYETIAEQIRENIKDDAIIISVTVNMTLKKMAELFNGRGKYVVTMPNTPSLVGEGVTLYDVDENITSKEESIIKEILGTFGEALRLEDKDIIKAGSLNGCSPAFIYMLIEAMSDAGIILGLKREEAIRISAATVKGAASMVLNTSLHPGQLKDMVTSPGGTTIEGVRSLEKSGLRSSIIEAVLASYKKSME